MLALSVACSVWVMHGWCRRGPRVLPVTSPVTQTPGSTRCGTGAAGGSRGARPGGMLAAAGHRPEFDDLACQAAADALVAIADKRGLPRPLTGPGRRLMRR